MAKQGMSRPERTHTQPHNDAPPVPELQGKAKHTKKKAKFTERWSCTQFGYGLEHPLHF